MSAALLTRESIEKDEALRLASAALRSAESRGRLVPEAEHAYRTAFQRDRDRVVHSTAFRRLQYKTQVFVYHEGDHYRNRLTHSLEGAQITRTIARALRLNEDLAEAIALAHDLGHTPFGHAGERVLARLLANDGGFDHNRQGLRVVDLLEQRYPDFDGLNLTDETREGILKHGCDWPHPVRLPRLDVQRSLEAQAADVSDEIAYMNHDLDDALRSGVVSVDMLGELPIAGDVVREVDARLGDVAPAVRRAQIVRALINLFVGDLLRASERRIEGWQLRSVEQVRAADDKAIGYSPDVTAAKRTIKAFLYENFYDHPRVTRMTREAEGIVDDLFRVLREDPGLLPDGVRERFGLEGEMRAIADYIAGMTDRFAMSEHRKLLDPHETNGV